MAVDDDNIGPAALQRPGTVGFLQYQETMSDYDWGMDKIPDGERESHLKQRRPRRERRPNGIDNVTEPMVPMRPWVAGDIDVSVSRPPAEADCPPTVVAVSQSKPNTEWVEYQGEPRDLEEGR